MRALTETPGNEHSWMVTQLGSYEVFGIQLAVFSLQYSVCRELKG